MSIGFGLIGLGSHGSRYARHLLEGVAGCHLVAVSRRDTAAGESFAQSAGIAFIADYREMVERKDIDAVVIVTPPNLNREIAVAAAKAGKAVLIEKPLAMTTGDARIMVEAARAAGVPMMTAQTLRFTPVLRRLRERLPAIGPLEYLWLSMRVEPAPHSWLNDPAQAGGGALIEIGIHLIDLIRFLTGEEAVEVSAEIVRRHTDYVEDMALARFLLTSGVRCYVEVSRVSGGRTCRVEAVGKTGQLLADVNESVLSLVEGRKVTEKESVQDGPTIVRVLEEFANSLATGGPVPISGEDGLRAVAMAEVAYRSASEGRPIALSTLPVC
jgi:predicted dehydrogenase